VTSEITCLIVDDHEVVREGLRLSLSRTPHIRVVGEAADGQQAIDLAERRRPNVVIMDVRMPGMDGLDATKLLTEKLPDVSVLIFTAYSESTLLSRGLDSGALGYILKEAPHETLVRAIDKVAGGESFIDPALMPAFLSGKDRASGRSCSYWPTACRTPTSPSASLSARRPSRVTSVTSSPSWRQTRARTPSRSRSGTRSSTRRWQRRTTSSSAPGSSRT